MEKALVPLKQAIEKTEVAAKTSGGDKELVQVAKTLKDLSEKKTAERDTKRKIAVEQLAVANKARQTVGEMEKRLTASKVALDAATKTANDMTQVTKVAEGKLTAANKEVAAATTKVTTAQKVVDEINQELNVARTPKSAAVGKKEAEKKS